MIVVDVWLEADSAVRQRSGGPEQCRKISSTAMSMHVRMQGFVNESVLALSQPRVRLEQLSIVASGVGCEGEDKKIRKDCLTTL